ncbi:hypothetical protein QBC38DRAFT_547261 [Podospora fimiseda]|uniref:Cellobiose dehydrogenase-like cytochrome domain-containing protein n=1 Tax=Podospora fimiseda TaxID=252190 RepID=A0AAN7BKD4_9PEZI|nr:hypothetical protein QBC38DRAFT_547261 [Podospora fimiseda]
MGLKHIILFALSGTQILASENIKRQSQTKYCPGNTQICFSEFKVPTHDITYRIAIPDVSSAPFDVLLQIVAPLSTGWAAVAWGGKMTNNPLTVAWPNGKSAIVSSRFATSRTLPAVYTGATYSILPTSNTNTTHWQLDVLCRGCSQWSGGSLDPNGINSLAWAKSSAAPNTANSNTSSFGIHDGRGTFAHDLSAAKIPKGVFDAVAYDLENSEIPVVSTSVMTLARPTTTVSTRLTALPTSTTFVYVTTRVTQLPGPGTSTTYVFVTPKTTSTSTTKPTQVVVTVTVTATATPTRGGGPPWSGGGGPPWGGGGGGGGGWGKGKGKGWGRRERLAAEPEDSEE